MRNLVPELEEFNPLQWETVAESKVRYADLRIRTKSYALSVVRLYTGLPSSELARTLGRQLLRSGTSVGAHYREAYRARSVAEFVSKIEVLLQELDESIYWLELIVEAGVCSDGQTIAITKEAEQLVAIFTASVKTAKANR